MFSSGLWNEEKNKALFYQMDLNGDGKITRAEFITHFGPALPVNMNDFETAVDIFRHTAHKCRAQAKANIRELQQQALDLGCDPSEVNMAFDESELRTLIGDYEEAHAPLRQVVTSAAPGECPSSPETDAHRELIAEYIEAQAHN